MTSRKQLAINQRALYDDAVKNKMFWNATPSFQEFQRRLQNPKYVQTVQANYRAHGRSGDAFDTLSGFRDYFCVSDEDKQDMTQGVGNMIADTKARLAGQQRYNKLKQHQDKQRGRYGRLDLGVKNPLTNDNVVREPLTGRYLTSDGAEYAQEYEAARAQNHIDETGKRYTEAVERGDLPSAFEVRDEDGNYALMEDLGVKPGVHVTEKGKQQQLAGLVNTRKSVEEQYNALYRKLEEDFKRSAPFSINTHSQYGIDDNNMRLQAYLNSNAQYRRLKAQLHQLDNAIGVGEEAVKGRAEERYVKNAKGMLGYAYRDLKSFGASALRGLWNAVSDVSTWDLGLQDLQDNMTLYTTVKKARQKGYKNLNSEERQMLDVAAKTGAYTAENQQYLGRGYKAGNVTGESLPFMVEMALNPASGLGEAVMSKYMRNAIAKYGKEAVRKEAWKYVTKKCGYRVAGDVLGAALMTGTTGSARTLADTYDRLTGDIKSTYDSDGKIVYDGTENEEKGILKAYLKAFGATAIENHSEFVGEYFNPLLKGVGTLTMKGWKKVNAKSANAFLDNLKDMGSTSTAKWLGNLFDKTQWHGSIGEYAEEVVGNIENALLVGDSTLDTKEGTGVFNLDQNIDTFLGVSLMGGFFSTLKTGAYVRDKVKGERKILMQQSLDLDNSIRYALGADPKLSDKWKEWRVALAQGTDEEKKQALKEISENTNGNIKKAMYDYSANAQKLAGMDKATQGAIEDGTITPEQAQRDADIEQAHEEGLAAEGTARHDIQQEHQLRENSLARMLGISAEQLDRMEDEDIESMTGQNDALDTAIYDYQTSRERYQGVIDRATDEVEQAGIDAAHQIDLYTDHSTGQIRPCVIKGNNGKEDYQGYIVNGNIATHPDGAIDVSGSDKMILYFDPETGKIEHGDASTFASLGESADATVARQQAIDEAKQQAAQAQSRDIDGGVGEDGNVSEAMPTSPQSSDQEERNAADFDIGQVVNAETGEVIPVSFEGLVEGENAYLTGGRPDGKTKDRLKVTIVDAEGNVTNRVMKRGNVQVDGRMSAEDFRNAYEEAVSSRMAPEADMNGQENNVDEEGVVAGNAAPSADKAATSEEEGAASEPAVRDKNGNPIYDKMPISATIADLYDGALDDAEIDGFVSAQIAEAEKAVEKMEKKKPKVGTDKAKYLADKKAWEEGLQEAQRKVQYWHDVKAEVEKITTPEDARGYEEELNGDAAQTAYRNGSDAAAYGAREVTAEFMQSGDVKITPESYRKETGFGAAEQRAMVGKISKGGKSIDKLAEDLEVFDRENYNGMYFGGDSSVAKDAILDYLSSPDSRKGVKKMQSEAEREYVEAYEAERDRYYQEKYHMSYEEYLVYSSQEMPELLRKYSNFDEQLFLERYADEIEAALQKREEQLKQEENGKEGNVSAGEESGHGRSNQVQSGERTDDTGRGEVGKDSAGEVGPRHEGVVESEAAWGSGETEAGEHPLSSEDIEDGKLSVNDGRGDKGRIGERQGDLAKAVDDNGHPFILSSDGTSVFGEITEDSGLTAAPIRLSEGFNNTDERGNNIGYGLLHIQAGHGKQILEAGYTSVQQFVEDVCRNYKEIRIGRNRKSNQTYMLLELHDEKHKRTLYVELSHDGTYWNVNSGGIFRNKYTDKNDIVWPEPTVGSNANTDTAEVADSPTGEVTKGETVDRGGNSSQPISSGSKDTNNTDTKQGNEEKSVGGEKEPMSPTPAMIDRMIEEQRVDDVSELLISSELKKAAEGIAGAFGMKVVYLKKVFIRSNDPAVEDFEGNGFVRNGVIYLSLKEADIAQFTFGHELLHQLKQIDADSYMRIRQKVIDVMGRKAFEMEVKARQMTYANVPGYTLYEDYAEEVIADTLGDIITHTDMLPDIARSLKENPSLLDRFLKVVDNVRQYFRGKIGGALGDLVNDIRNTYEMTARQGAERDKFSLRLAEAKNNTDKNPSQAQKESGNYRKGHIRFGGYNYTIENPQGSYRSGVDENGKKWKQKMNNTYGYILGIKGKDGDHLDMFINDKADLDSWNGNVYVVDQVLPDGSFDEHKVMYGFGSEEDARKAYLSNYEQGWQGLGNITGVSKEDFDRWLEKSGRKTKAFSEYSSVKKETEGNKPSEASLSLSTPLTDEEVVAITDVMKANATVAPTVEINDANWKESVDTPIGAVKMGENQKAKLFAKGREQQYGMLLETLSNPDVVLEEKDKEQNMFHERPSSYLFVKTFQKEDGSKYVHFESVTVSQEGMEVSISSHIIRENQLKNKLKSDRLLYKATALDAPANTSAEQPIVGGSLSSDGKDTEKVSSGQEDGEKSVLSDLEREFQKALEHEEDVEQKWEDKIQDYVAEHYPTQATVSAATTSAKGVQEREAMKSDHVLRAMREKADAEYKEARDATFAAQKKMETAKEKMAKVRLQKDEGYSEFAEKHGVSADDVRRYAEGMLSGNLALANQAFASIRVAKRRSMVRTKLSEFAKIFSPIEKELYERFGNINDLREEYVRRVEEERSMMEAARKRAEEEQRKREARLEELAVLTDEEIDRSYAEALAKGDVAAAREMLDEAARRKGYGDVRSDYQGVGAWSAPSNPDYETDEARRNAVGEDSPDLNVEDMAAGYSNQPEDIFVHPNKYSQGLPTSKESGNAIQTAIDDIRNGKKDVTVKVYRAVPTSVKEGKLRNGDWVTPSRKYAELHGSSRLEGKYRIIEDEVPVSELWWDGNDVNEWGYDNGKGYRYKNVKNNRKLNDLVTRDDNGNVIPPSKRFNQRKADERFQRGIGGVKPSKAEAVLRDAVIDRLRENGMEVITDVAEGQKVLDEANGMVRLMGSRTNKKMKEIADVLSEHELSEQQKTVVDVYSGTTDNLQLEVSRNDGNRRIVIRQGNDNKAGTKHSVYRHYGTTEGVITAEDILLIPEVLNRGERKSIKRGNTQLYEYVLRNVDGAEYTVLTEINNRGKETFADFYSNKKVSSTARKTRSSEAQARLDETLSAAKVEEKSKTANKSGEKLREQRVYHGSGADFEAFDHGHMGEGQGSQVFGWGTYVTSSKAIGESYAQDSAMGDSPRMEMEYTGDVLTENEVDLLKYAFDGGMRSYHETEEFLEKIANSDKPGAKLSANALSLLRKTKPDDWTHPLIGKRQLYTVEIPEDNGSNYLDWENPLNDAQKEILKEGLMAAGVSVEYFKGLGFTLDSSFKYVYSASLPMMLRGVHVGKADNVKEKASRFLSGLGFTGIKYPAGTIHGGAEKGDMNYVIFNEKDAKITDHVRFFRTANGEAYGFTVGGKIYVDPRIATSETPVHEYAHLWATALRNGNKEEWQNVVGLMKDSKVWDEVKGRYPELKTDDEIADEVIATYSGRRGAERLREEQRKIAEGDGGVFEKAEAISALEHVKRALKMFWKGVADFLHIHYKSAEEVADRVMKDLLEGVDPRKMGDGVDRQRYASIGVSMSLGEEAAEGEPRYASLGLSEPRGEREQQAANERFNNELQQQIDGKLPSNHIYRMGQPGKILLSTGVPDLPIQMNATRLKAKATSYGHDFELSEIKDLVRALQHPLAVFAYGNKSKAQNIIVPLQKDGKNFIVGLSLNPTVGGRSLEINSIRNVFPKNNSEWLNWISQGKALYLDKEKVQTLIDQQRTILADVEYLDLNSVAKIVESFVNPKISDEKYGEGENLYDDTIRFSLRQEPAPKVTKKGYAVFIYKKLKNGGYKLVPKMLSNDPGAPAQTWLNADTGYMKRDENGEPLQNTNGRASVSVNGSQAGGNKSNKLAWRPGKHLAMYPNASQFKSPDGTIPKDVIFFEVEYAADPDLHKQYQRNAWELGMNDNGQYRNNQGGLPYIPKDSYYLYRTNSISEGATPMIITGAYKINRALTDAEAKELNQNAGGMWCPRKGGDLTEEKLKDMGLDDKGLKKMTESFDMDTIKESHDESDEARLLPGYKSREINWEDKDLIHSIEENGQDINDYRDGYVAPEHSEEPTIRFSLDKDKGTVASPSKPSKAEAVLRDAVIDRLRENGMEVITDVAEGQKVLDEANGEDVMLSAKQKRALETATMADESTNKATVVSSADGAKVQNNLEILADSYKNRPNKAKGFITDLSRSLGLEQHEASQYGTFVTENGKTVTIRVSNHNARVSFFDKNGENDGISIVISNHKNKGLLNDGNAHIIEFFYSKQSLQRADSKPLSDIIRSVSEALYSGEFKDTTGLAERQEVNAKQIREQRMGGADGLRFFRTANGEAYGFTVGGKIYVDPRIATSETPVHEYAHLWASALRNGNVEEWQNVVGLMKDSKVWDEVKKRYPELKTDDEIADEVIATYSGRRGAERLREEQRKIAEGDGGVFEKAEAISALEHVKRALKVFWKGVADFLHIHYKSAEEVADRVMKDLLEGVDPRKMGDGVDRQLYASLGVSRSLGEEAGEGEPRYASWSLSEQQLDGDDTIRFSLNYDKWDREMASWLKRNRLPKNAQRPVVPQREVGESDLHFAGRLAKYNQDKALWNTAPKYEGHLSSGMTARGEFNYELQRGAVLKRIAIQDSMLAIRKAQEAIARHSGFLKVGTFEDAYMAENNSHGKAKNEFEQYDQEYLEPLRKWFNVMMKRLDGSYNNVTNYMIAKHGLERNAHMAFMAALEAEAKKAIGNTQPDAKRLRAQMVHDAYKQYKADSRRLINDADYEAGKYDYAQWRRTDDAIRKSYCSNYESFRYNKGGVVRDYAGLSSLFLNETDFEEKAAEMCADIEGRNGHETGELWDAVRQATRQILKNSHDAGMMSDETYDYVRGMYEHYIPLRGWNDSAADEVWDYAGGGRGVFNAALKEAHGRQSLADDPVAYIMNMAESGFLVNNRNWVKQHFLTMAMNHPTDLLTVSKAWYVKTKDQFGNEVWIPASPNIPVDETDPAVIEAALNAFQTKMEQMEQSGDATQQRGSLNIEYPQTKSEEREHEVRVMKDGEEYVIYVNGDPQLAQALNNTRAMRVRQHEGLFEKACAWLGRKMAAVYTSLSPLFVPSNWARDTTMTLASTAIREDARYNWLLRTKFMRPDVQMRMFGLVKEYQNGKLREKVKSRTATKTEENFWNFMINGGETGFVSTMDVDAFREKIQRDLKDMGRTRLNPVKVGHTIADSVEYINRVIEDSNRFAIYQTSIEYGRGIEEAVQDAKNVTLNFNRKGTGEMGMSAIRQLYLFINPAIQSLQTLGALAKDHKAKFTAVSSAWMASGMLVPLFNELMFNLASAAAGGGGDDDDEFNPKDEYWKFSSFDRRNNCILWIPFTHNFIKIPLAQEFRGFYGIGDMVASAMWGGENAKESWSNYAADLMGQIIDLSPLDPVSYDGNVLVSLMPNAIRPLVEIAQNVTFTGKPIYRESDFNKYDPSFKKAYAGTPDFLLRYSKWMNSIGNKYPEAQQGPVEQTAVGRYANNPAVIDHLLKSYLGGMYTLGSQIAGAITKASDEETRKDFKTADIPFFSKFVANPNDRPQSKNKGDAYWQDFEKYQRSSHTLGVIRQDARKTGNFSVLEDFYKSEEYKEMKEYEPKAKQRKEEQKYERWKEEGNADLYQPHQQTGEDVYKRHSTPADDFEDTKASILYQKIKPAKDIFDLADVNTPSGMDTFNKYYDLAGKVEEAHSVKKEMNAIVKSFVNDEHKTTFDPEKMKEYRALRKQYLQLVEEGNRMFEKIKAQRN